MPFSNTLRFAALVPLALIAACSTIPTGTSVMALPGTGKSFDQFRADDAGCNAFAQNQIGGTNAQQAALDSGVKSAAVGTAVGALAGAAIGGHQGAGAGAAAGLLVGSVAGAGAAQTSGYGAQRRYDNAYVQCMYANGEKVPVSGQFASPAARSRHTPAPSYAPPPPPGYAAPAPR